MELRISFFDTRYLSLITYDQIYMMQDYHRYIKAKCCRIPNIVNPIVELTLKGTLVKKRENLGKICNLI